MQVPVVLQEWAAGAAGRMQDLGCRMRDMGYRMQGAGSCMQDRGCRMSAVGCEMQDRECGMQGAGCETQGAGYRTQDVGFRWRWQGGGLLDKGSSGISRFAIPLCPKRRRHCGRSGHWQSRDLGRASMRGEASGGRPRASHGAAKPKCRRCSPRRGSGSRVPGRARPAPSRNPPGSSG